MRKFPLIPTMNSPVFRRLFFGTAIFGFLAAALAGEEVLPLNSKKPAIYKSPETVASAEPDAEGEGVKLSYDFEAGGETVRFSFPFAAPIDGPFSHLVVTARGNEGSVILMLRDATNRGISYNIGPISAESQDFTVDLANPALAGQKQERIEFPIRELSFTIRKPAALKGMTEITKVVAKGDN